MSKESNVAAAARQFEISGEFFEAEPYGSGHINDTYRVFFREGGASCCHILQRINHNIFKNPVAADGKHPARHGASCHPGGGRTGLAAGAC